MALMTDDSLPVDAPPCFHLLAKPSGSTCNIDCKYCFFLSEEALYPNDKQRMSENTLDTLKNCSTFGVRHASVDPWIVAPRAQSGLPSQLCKRLRCNVNGGSATSCYPGRHSSVLTVCRRAVDSRNARVFRLGEK